MEWKLLGTVAVTTFIAELGDKTQLTTLLFAADRDASKWTVFAGAALGLVAAAGLGVLAGEAVSRQVEPRALTLTAGAAFVAIGIWTLAQAW